MNLPHLPTRELLLSVLVITALAAHAYGEEPSQAATIAAIEKLGGSVRLMSHGNRQDWEVEFHLRGGELTDDDLAMVAALSDIVSLNLRDTKITGAGLVHLKDLDKLRILHLERTAVDDAGVAHLTGLNSLEYLNLYSTRITDESLEPLARLTNLKTLYVWQTGVSEAGAARLEKRLPGLRIIRGVDLSKLPAYDEVAAAEPKPKVDLKWIATTSAADVPKSAGGGLNTQVVFENKSKRVVKLYWLDFAGKPMLYGTLAAGATRAQNSYSKHTWLITDEKGKPLGYFVVREEVSRATIP